MDPPEIPFIPGLELSRRYYFEAVQPILMADFPNLRYTACLIGYGSDVIGIDTTMSRDHMWGPRLVLFLAKEDFENTKKWVDLALREGLPHSFYGYPTSFGPPDSMGVRLLRNDDSGSVDHLIEINTLPAYFDRELGKGRWQDPTIADWLTFSEHRLLTLTTGGVFHDDLDLELVRNRLAYYPRDVWLYLLASEWRKIGQEEPFVGRAGLNKDDLGSRIITARLVGSCMRLGFLLERRYTPYSKWFGTVFAKLEIAPALVPILAQALTSATWEEREKALCAAYEMLSVHLNDLHLTSAVETRCLSFHDRPFQVIHGDQIAERLREAISNPEFRQMRLYGSVNQLSDSTDLLEESQALGKLRNLYSQL